MLTLYIGNKAYSSWSLRGWLAVKQSGLPFTEVVVPMWTEEHERVRASGRLPSGKLPTLWDGGICVWDSFAILEYLAERVGREAYWPLDDAARGLARSIAAEMHSGFTALRQQAAMNLRRTYPDFQLDSAARSDVDRIDALWQEARTRFGAHGPYLFGAFGAADIMFAPVVTRFATYGIGVSPVAQNYVTTMLAQPFLAEWYAAAQAEPWRIDRYER